MPGKLFILKVIGIILEYGLIVLLYYFMFRLLKAIYREFYVVSPNFSVSVPLIQETEGAVSYTHLTLPT
ncbi:MAG: hypothetical protein H6Q67_1603, partial [Firmicutes bacterium]|nr:hypothetical protein [Bacillota bacterium]